MAVSVGVAAIEAFQKQGAVHLQKVFSNYWLEYLEEAFEIAVNNPGPFAEELAPTGEGRFFADLELFHRLPHFETFSRESPCAEIAAQLMDSSKINFFYDQLFVKWPGTTKETLYHQDLSYWAVSGEKICSVWIPLDPMTSEQGLRFVKGSHLWPLCAPMAFQDGKQYLGSNLPQLPLIDDSMEILSWDTQPGDCIVFNAKIVHGSLGNQTDRRQRRLATRWCGDDVQYDLSKGETFIPTENIGLQQGDILDSWRFPVVWTKEKC